MPRLMMSRPCAASALARANTAKAFSSPMRSKAGTVFSMAFPLGALFGVSRSIPRSRQIGRELNVIGQQKQEAPGRAGCVGNAKRSRKSGTFFPSGGCVAHGKGHIVVDAALLG